MTFDELKNKTILITGGSSGMGKATAIKATSAGAIVGVISNNKDEFNSMPLDINCYHADIRSSEQVSKAVENFIAKHKRIDVLINSAGVSLWKNFLEMDEVLWDLIYDVNVKGTFLMSQTVAKYMVKQKNGLILNISSMSGLKSGTLNASAYASSKWAIVGLSRNLHLELKQYGIKVGCFCPGSTKTDLHKKVNSPNQDKMLEPEEVAETILFMIASAKKGHVQLLAQPAFFEEWK